MNLRVTFQKYDSDWECFVEEGYAVVHKDKLKAVITPLLRDSSNVTTDTEVSLLLYTCKRHNLMCDLANMVSVLFMAKASYFSFRYHNLLKVKKRLCRF